MSKFRGKCSHPKNDYHPDHKKYHSTRSMQLSNSLLINGSNSNRVANHGEFSDIEVPFAQRFMSDANAFIFQPSKNYVEGQGDYRRGSKHSIPEDNVLGVVAGSVGDCCPGEGFLFVVFYGHMVGVEGRNEEDWHVKVHQWVDFEPAEKDAIVQGFLRGWLSEHLFKPWVK